MNLKGFNFSIYFFQYILLSEHNQLMILILRESSKKGQKLIMDNVNVIDNVKKHIMKLQT